MKATYLSIIFMIFFHLTKANGDIQSFQTSWNDSYIILEGKVIGEFIPKSLIDIFTREYKITTFKINKVYKGSKIMRDTHYISILSDKYLFEDFSFNVDSIYLLYIYKKDNSPFFFIDRYSRTDLLRCRREDIEVLKRIKDTSTTSFYKQYLSHRDTSGNITQCYHKYQETNSKNHHILIYFLLTTLILESIILIYFSKKRFSTNSNRS